MLVEEYHEEMIIADTDVGEYKEEFMIRKRDDSL